MNRPRQIQTVRRASAFTIVELLAVIAVVALLASIVKSASAGSRVNRSTVECRNNLKQLTVAWSMYAEDNHGQLVCNDLIGPPFSCSWVGGWLDFSASPDNTNVALLIDHKAYSNYAYLGPYLQTAGVFKCPEDKSAVRIAGILMPRVRSVSLNNYLGGQDTVWSPSGPVLLFTNMARIKFPSRMFVMLDERPESIHGGSFACDASTAWQLVGWPGFYHQGGGNFSFVDGHTETHRWKDLRTMPKTFISSNVNIPGDPDIPWLQHHAAGLATLP
jgi:prepilin-type processing-associated H-X9-DG protein